MGLRINTNVASLMAQRQLNNNTLNLNGNFSRLSSGERISKAADDAAGLAISENLKAQIRSVRQAQRNTGDAISLIQTAEGGLSEISNLVIRLRELAVQAGTDTMGEKDRAFSDIEFQHLKEEIDRISRSAEFNGKKLLDGTSGQMEFQIGTRNDPVLDRLRYDGEFTDATLSSLGLNTEAVTTKQGAQASLQKLDNALVKINGVRSSLGALQNRLASTANNLGSTDENLSAANSRIRDVDVANETAKLTNNNILVQAGTSVLAQANQFPSLALKLLNA